MRRSALLALACLVAAAVGAQDLTHVPLENWYPDGLHVNTTTAITGTWTAVAGSPIIVRASGSAAVESEVAVGANITIGGYGYRVAARADGAADADTITITPTRDPATGQRRPGATASATGQAIYLIGLGLSATAAEVEDGAGTGSGVWLDNAGNLTAEGTIHAGRDDDKGDVDIHHAGTLTLRDSSDDTAVVLGPVGDGTTVAAVTGTLNADGLQIGGAAVLTPAGLESATMTGHLGNITGAASSAVTQSWGVWNRTVVTVAVTGANSVTLADGAHGGGKLVWSAPEGVIAMAPVLWSGTVTNTNAFNASTADTFVFAIGNATAADDATLMSNEANLIFAQTVDTDSGVTLTRSVIGCCATANVSRVDGSTTPIAAYVNFAIADANNSGANTFTAVGTLTFDWLWMYDY